MIGPSRAIFGWYAGPVASGEAGERSLAVIRGLEGQEGPIGTPFPAAIDPGESPLSTIHVASHFALASRGGQPRARGGEIQ